MAHQRRYGFHISAVYQQIGRIKVAQTVRGHMVKVMPLQVSSEPLTEGAGVGRSAVCLLLALW